MDEVGGYEQNPSWIASKFGANKRKDGETEKILKYGIAIAKYLGFNIPDDELKKGIEGNYQNLKAPGKQGFVQLVKSIYASKNNKPPVGLTKGQIEWIMRSMGQAVERHVGANNAKSPEAFAIFLGQMAQSMGGHISLEPNFEKEVQDYFADQHANSSLDRKEKRKDAKKAAEVKRNGLPYVASQIRQMGLSDETIQDLGNIIQQAMSNANRSGRNEDAVILRQFLIALTKGTP